MRPNVVVVFTGESTQTIVNEGGTSAWKLDRAKAAKCKYVICVRNANTKWGRGDEPHRSAFLIGEIRDVVASRPAPGNDQRLDGRSSIVIERYADLDLPKVWVKGMINPVNYRQLQELGIDLAKLRWQLMSDEPMRPVKARIPR